MFARNFSANPIQILAPKSVIGGKRDLHEPILACPAIALGVDMFGPIEAIGEIPIKPGNTLDSRHSTWLLGLKEVGGSSISRALLI